jgi:hypothetical protein
MTKIINEQRTISPVKNTKITLEERLALFDQQHGGEIMATTPVLGAEKLRIKFKSVAFKLKQGL